MSRRFTRNCLHNPVLATVGHCKGHVQTCVPFFGYVEHTLLCVCHAEKCFEWGGTQKGVTRILYSVVFLPSRTIFELHEKE